MKRKLSQYLIQWKKSKHSKPLIIQGARQVGKTHIIKEFGNTHFAECLYMNFEVDLALSTIFEKDLHPDSLIRQLEVYFNKNIDPANTLLFFDEIQVCERALTSLKYFFEEATQYFIVAAGSLLGVAVNRKNYSFPVGKVDMQTLYPMDFEEFLWAAGHEMLAQEIRNCYIKNEPCPFNEKVISLYHDYLITGGMPEAVLSFSKESNHLLVSSIQQQILNSYIADMAKYALPAETNKIMATFRSIPVQLAKENKKFQYNIVQRGGSSGIFGPSIDWLAASGIVIKCSRVEKSEIPLAGLQDLTSFKLYMGDTGLLTQLSGMPLHDILSQNYTFNSFMGSITENYVANALTVNGFSLYYWNSGNTAEIDFLIQKGAEIIPIEVKAGKNVRSRSLSVYREKYKPSVIIRLSSKNFGYENNIKSVPLYAAFCIEK